MTELIEALEKEVTTHSSILAWRIPMDRGAWRVIVHRVAKSWTRLKACMHSMHSGTGASLVAQLVKNPSAMQEALVRFLGQEVPLKKG